MLQWAGETVAMMEVFVRPPRESCNILVSLLSLLKHTTTYCNHLYTKLLHVRINFPYSGSTEQTIKALLHAFTNRYGIWGALSTNAVITLPSVKRLWLMLPVYEQINIACVTEQ